MSISKNDIQGNASVSRNLNVGGHANVNGDALINHNLVVKGWVDAPNIKGPLKGMYASEETLNAAYPRPMPGWFALVGNTLPADVYRVERGKWIPTGEKGGEFNLWLDQLEGLNDEIKATQNSLEKETSDRTAADTALGKRIDNEATTRAEADSALGARLNDLKRSVDEKTLTVDADILALQNAVWPLDVAFAVAPSVVKADTQTTVALSWSARRKGGDVTAQAAVELDGSLVSGNTKNVAVTVAHAGTRQFALKVSFEGLIVTRTCTVRGTLPTYFGTVSGTWAANEAAIKALTELTVGSRALSRTGIALNDGKIALAYPKDLGVLASIKDGNGYEVLSSYTRSEIRVNGNDYYCYLLTVPVTATGVTQIYS